MLAIKTQVLDSILLVDDDPIANKLHENLLNELGLVKQIVIKKNGREAYEYIEQSYRALNRLPSLILADLSMPVMDGFEFVKELSGSELLAVNKIPLAVVSVSNAEQDKLAIKKLGNYHFTSKPLNKVKLFDIFYNTVVPLLSPERQLIFMERQKLIEDQMSFLKQQNSIIKQQIEEIKNKRIQLENKFKKYL